MNNRKSPRRRSPGLYIALLAGVVIVMISLRHCSVASPFDAPDRQRSGGDTIDVAIEYGPTTLYVDGDTLAGDGYDAIRRAAGDSMVLKFHPVASLADAFADLRNGLADIVVAEMAATAGIDSTFRFSEPVGLDRQVLVQRVDTPAVEMVTSVLGLAGKRVTVSADSPMLVRLHNIEAEIGDSIDIAVDSIHGPEQLFLLVAVGEIDYAVVNERTAAALAPDYPSVNIDKGVSFNQFQSWVMRADNPSLAARIDSAIIRMQRRK